MIKTLRKPPVRKYTVREKLFVYALIFLPLLQFIVMWVMVKADTLLLAFEKYDNGNYLFCGLENFKKVFFDLFSPEGNRLLLRLTGNSLLIFLAGIVVYPIPLYISYIIWKKLPFSQVFKIIMYLPCIIPGMVTALSFRYFMGLGLPKLFNDPSLSTLITDSSSMNISLFLYSFWIGLGGSFVINLGAMSAVDQSLVEYGQIDGLGFYGEFIHIVLPKIWPTIIVVMIGKVSLMLDADVGLYNFFRETKFENVNTNIGYHKTILTLHGPSNYGYLSAFGLLQMFILIPTIYTVKYLMGRFGPKED